MGGLAIIRDASLVVALSFAVGVGTNAVQREGIPVIAKEAYHILVPCPVEGGEVLPLRADEVRWGGTKDLVIDARPATQAAQWPTPGARNVPYDFLDPIDDATVADLVSRPVERIVVVGDGLAPDSGREMGAELSGRGVRNVHYVEGGWKAARKHLDEVMP
ncbi:MAG: rhodanese-like domain-containing protein [Deltaproteobacteria bacterium]|nr:rhodanese-like domain-containing protein [Deltaproteobacteria bacterium]MBW2256437.1 rhodanese-like domain-containing protein [Deltaproteobacteria bacterium]